jgi:DNA/RNA-binding domain of Phe-tRNA-synthetase-like protein
MVQFCISDQITKTFPTLFVNLIIVRDMNNVVENRSLLEIDRFARTSEAVLRTRFLSKRDLDSDPMIATYFEMFRAFGTNPKRTKPSHYALADRVIRGGVLPNINPAVNLYNAFSVKHVVPFGEDLDKVDDYFELAFAKGVESWQPIGEDEPRSTREGDVVWRDATQVSTTSLNYRQCEKTKLVPSTRNAYFITEGFTGVNETEVDAMSREFVDVFGNLLGGRYTRHIINNAVRAVDV